MKSIIPSKASVWLIRFDDTDTFKLLVCPVGTTVEEVHKRVMTLPHVDICKFTNFKITRIDTGEFEIIAIIDAASSDNRQMNQDKQIAGKFRRFIKRKKRRQRDES